MYVQVKSRPSLIKNPLIIEGITRSGKFLLANLLAGLADMEPPQYFGLLEDLPYLVDFNLIDKKTALNIFRCEIDFHFYEMLIGRSFNHRVSDKSSIYNIPNYQQFLTRCKTEDREKLVNELKDRYGMFIIHEGMPHLSFYFEALPKLKVISISRNPYELVYSWYQRGLGKRWGADPVLFQIALDYKDQPIPWFARSWAKDYTAMSEMDRVIKSMLTLMELSAKTYQQLSPQIKKRILLVTYEDILLQPQLVVNKIERFLNRPSLPTIKQILKREQLPNRSHSEKLAAKIALIKKEASADLFLKLSQVAEAENFILS